jgi:hypothetical protein
MVETVEVAAILISFGSRRWRCGDAADLRPAWWPRTARSGVRPGCAFEDPLDIVDEAHAQHFVGFVEHQRLSLSSK